MYLLLIDINHFVAFGTFLYVSKTICFVKVDFIVGEIFIAIFAWSLFLLVFHFLYFEFRTL